MMFHLGRVQEVWNPRVYEAEFEVIMTSEERIWRDACELKSLAGKEQQLRIAKSTYIPRFGAQIYPQNPTVRETYYP